MELLQSEFGLAPTIAEAAKLLGESRSTVRRKVYDGRLRVLQDSGIIRIPLSEIQKYLSRTKVYESKRQPGKQGRPRKTQP